MEDAVRNTGYSVDFVFCIDGTATMTKHLDRVKETARSMVTDIQKLLEERKCTVAQIRAKIILFRDYLADGDHAMLHTDFLMLPQQIQEFEGCLDGIVAEGGGDASEDGLEALAYAIKAKWETKGAKKRHIIVVWTDASTHELGYGKSSQYYPRGMARDIGELEDWWNILGEKYCSMMILFTPEKSYWDYISRNWDSVIHFPSDAGEGLEDRTYREILSAIHDPP